MATFVICHGAWVGGWFWRDCASRIQSLGHEVYRPTLTGLGQRRHLATPATNLDTHVEDIVSLIECEQLDDVALVGHSYGGAVITGVAERIPEKIARLVYVDAYVPQDGQSLADLFADSPVAMQLGALAERYGEGWKIPYPSSEIEDARIAAQPLQTFLQPLEVKNPEAARIPRAYIKCSDRDGDPIHLPLEQMAAQAQALGWRYEELPTGHNPNITMPDETAALLDRISRDA